MPFPVLDHQITISAGKKIPPPFSTINGSRMPISCCNVPLLTWSYFVVMIRGMPDVLILSNGGSRRSEGVPRMVKKLPSRSVKMTNCTVILLSFILLLSLPGDFLIALLLPRLISGESIKRGGSSCAPRICTSVSRVSDISRSFIRGRTSNPQTSNPCATSGAFVNMSLPVSVSITFTTRLSSLVRFLLMSPCNSRRLRIPRTVAG